MLDVEVDNIKKLIEDATIFWVEKGFKDIHEELFGRPFESTMWILFGSFYKEYFHTYIKVL